MRNPNEPQRILLGARDLWKSFGGQEVLRGVSLEIRQGEVILLRGDNGSGKTTLLNILTGCLEPDAGVIEYSIHEPHREFRFPRRWWEEVNPLDHFLPERVVREGICRTWQDARLFESQTLSENVAVSAPDQYGENPLQSLFACGKTRADELRNQKATELLLKGLGIASDPDRPGGSVPFGYAKLAAVARAARTGAKIIFLDEPLAGLDEEGVANVLRLLRDFVHRAGLTLVIVEHALNVPALRGLATTLWFLEKGVLEVVPAAGKIGEAEPDEAVQRLLNGVAPGRWQVRAMPLYGGAVLRKASHEDIPVGPPILRVQGLVVRRGSRVVVGRSGAQGLEGLSFDIHAGELCFLEGPNGWGKTTLFEAIAGLLRPSDGVMELHGKAVNDASPWEQSRGGLAFLQSRENFFSSLTVQETFDLAGNGPAPDVVASLLEKQMGDLSGGEKRRVGLARIQAANAAITLLDEPFEGLDETMYRKNLPFLKPSPARCFLVALPAASAATAAVVEGEQR